MFGGPVIWRGIVYTILMVLAKLFCGLCLIRFTSPIVLTRVLKKYMPTKIAGRSPWPIHMTAIEPQCHQPSQSPQVTRERSSRSERNATIPKPMSLYPATMLGSAMVARGEIGFLISGVAESQGVFGPLTSGGSSELYLIVTWAILLCTLLGPIVVGLMVKRVKRLQVMERSQSTGKEDPLGIWGLQDQKSSNDFTGRQVAASDDERLER